MILRYTFSDALDGIKTGICKQFRGLRGQHRHFGVSEQVTYSLLSSISRGYHIALIPKRKCRVSKSNSVPLFPGPQKCSLAVSLLSRPLPSRHHSLRYVPTQSNFPPLPQVCLVPPSTSPCTFVQSIVPSNSSSNRPTTATLSPRTIYKPSGTSSLATSSSRGRMMRSIADWRTRFMDPSHECRVPIMVRPSRVRTVTRSGG
jgi:hypothetical protein